MDDHAIVKEEVDCSGNLLRESGNGAHRCIPSSPTRRQREGASGIIRLWSRRSSIAFLTHMIAISVHQMLEYALPITLIPLTRRSRGGAGFVISR
jgi:hypothetical protein